MNTVDMAAYRIWKAVEDMKQANSEVVACSIRCKEESDRLVEYVEKAYHTTDRFYYGEHLTNALMERKSAIKMLIDVRQWIEMFKEVTDGSGDPDVWIRIDQNLTESEELLGLDK